MANNAPRRLRCAIYTRKSTEEGLDQAFNSLDAQREACTAYILSQRHEGWQLVPALYDDGGFTGGNMERPGLQRLMEDIRTGKVHVVVVYKVDRLTRSLSDFAKIVEILDAAEASFVSVTQAFNTTNSMGRLTLNVLLSFAQFEREVTAERIRDKVAASRARGMWMGGALPLGYTVVDKKLVPVPEEAQAINDIMQRYLTCQNVAELRDALDRKGVVSKRVVSRKGHVRGGIPLTRGALHYLLSNRTYLGEVVHNGRVYPGEHGAIVDRALFEAVQDKLAQRTNRALAPGARCCASLLAGMIRDEQGRPMSPAHTRNHGRRYRYYASNRADDASTPALRLPAGELDAAVKRAFAGCLKDAHALLVISAHLPPHDLQALVTAAAALAGRLEAMSVAAVRMLLQDVGLGVVLCYKGVEAEVSSARLLQRLGFDIGDDQALPLTIPTAPLFRGHEPRLRLELPAGPTGDPALIQIIASGFAAREQLLGMTEDEAAATPGTRLRHLERYARLSYLAPDIVRAIMAGKQPRQLTARHLSRCVTLPLCWTEQRRILGFAAN
ncbi:MAG: recombinase family protein [Pseudomonadota bacterium]